jgi:prepilin-type N-terminal cleavage/methylation domain-containing protein
MRAARLTGRSLARRLAGPQDGFTLIELTVAISILIVGIMGMFMGFITSQRASVVAERETSMTHIAQQQIEFVEGIPYSQVGLSSIPSTSTHPTNPDYYVTAGSTPTFEWNRTTGASENLDIDTTTPGVVTPVQSWSEGRFSGKIHEFVTWTTDPNCSPACPSSQDYKRITVAVTSSTGSPSPVYVSSVVADPPAASGNPLTNPATTCANSQGVSQPCTSLIDSGNPNTYYLHDWSATGGTPQPPSSDHVTHATVAAVSSLLCAIGIDLTGCPTPDLMDNTPPAAADTTLYHYSTDQHAPDASYTGGRILQPLCPTLGTLCSGSSGGGTGQTSDCSANTGFLSNLLNVQAGFWVSSPVTATTTLTGDGGISLYSQTVGGASAVVSFCLEIYDIPPSNGVAGSLSDILAWPPVALGGAGYVGETDPATGGNWPTSATQVSYIFNFRGSNGAISIAPGHRLGVRLWFKANLNAALELLYDNPLYPTQLQLNTQ